MKIWIIDEADNYIIIQLYEVIMCWSQKYMLSAVVSETDACWTENIIVKL